VNTNRIKRQAFSNPGTERFYQKTWTEERSEKAVAEGKICGLCCHGTFLLPSEAFQGGKAVEDYRTPRRFANVGGAGREARSRMRTVWASFPRSCRVSFTQWTG
jgi:hypothetical protein